jgi:hypothetical protein
MLIIRVSFYALNIDNIYNVPKIKITYWGQLFTSRYYSLAPVKQYGHSVETGQPKFANRLPSALILHQQASE